MPMPAIVRNIWNAFKSPSTGSANSALGNLRFVMDNLAQLRISKGVVVRPDSGLYSVLVRCDGGKDVTCIVASAVSTSTFGASEAYLPPPGTEVLVYHAAGDPYGIILGCIPAVTTQASNSAVHYQVTHPETQATSGTEKLYSLAALNKQDRSVLSAHMGRALDIFPGDRLISNQFGCCLGLGALASYIKAGDMAKIECCALDDMVRITSGFYQHSSSQGLSETYNDGGFITTHTRGTMYQCERSGALEYGTDVFEKQSAAATSEKGPSAYIKDGLTSSYKAKAKTLKQRFALLLGYLGDIFNMFVTVPKAESSDGLFHAHVDSDGFVSVKSASGISFQRTDIIPVPEQLKRPEDPSGDHRESEDFKPEIKLNPEEFVPEDQAGSRPALLRDLDAMRTKNAYLRFLEAKKDWKVPDAAAVATPTDQYDTQSGSSTKFSAHPGKQSYFNLEPDGSIVVRDAWGSEIVLANGNITFSCSGDIRIQSGNSTVVLAGHDAVIKAKSSIDLTATDHDVRIKGEKNVQVLGYGVLVQSAAVADSNGFVSGAQGEQLSSSGITLQAATSRVLVAGQTVHAAARNQVILETPSVPPAHPKPHDVVGKILMVSPVIDMVTRDNIAMVVGADTSMSLTPFNTALACKGIDLVSNGSMALVEGGDKLWVPLQKVKNPTGNLYETLHPPIQDINEKVIKTNEWLYPYAPEQIAHMYFTYRSSPEYGINSSTFKMYQPAWSYMAKNNEITGVSTTTWKETPINNRYPWPGSAGYDESSLVYFSRDKENYRDAGKLKSFDKIVQQDPLGLDSGKPFSNYEVRS